MLSELITSDVIRVHPQATDWQDAVQKSCQALIDNGAVEARYVDAIFRSHQELGPRLPTAIAMSGQLQNWQNFL